MLYTDLVQDSYGRPISGVSVYVLTAAGALVSLTNSAGVSITNPALTDASGRFTFYAADGVYNAEFRYGGVTVREDDLIVGNPPQYVGPAGGSDNTYVLLSAFKASDVSRKTASLVGLAGIADGRFNWTSGDFTGQADDINIIKADSTALTIGAWVRQSSAGVTAKELGTGAVLRMAQVAMQDAPFSAKGRGAIADGTVRAGVDVAGINASLTAANSGRAESRLTRGSYRMASSSESVALPQSYSNLVGEAGSYIYGFNAPVLKAAGVSYVLSSVKNLNLAGGTYGADIAPLNGGSTGEIASFVWEDVTAGDYSVGGFRFAGGVTSAVFNRITVNGSIGSAAGWESLGGINNNNVVSNSHFTNCSGPAMKTAGLTQALLLLNNRVEGAGQPAVAQYNFNDALGVHLLGGWSETSHEFLLKITGTNNPTDGMAIDGLVSIGSTYSGSGGLVASKFDVGQHRVIFGTNWWSLATTAPARCFIYGVNKNLLTDASVVHTRALRSSEHAVARKRSFAVIGDQTFSFLHLTRTDASNVPTNQQVFSATMYVTLSGYDAGGVARFAVWRVEMAVHAVGSLIDDPNSYITTTLAQGNPGALTLTVQKSASVTATDADLQMVFTGVNTALNNYVQYELNMRNLSSTEAGRFAINVL